MSAFKEYYLWFKKRFFPLRITILLLILLVPLVERLIYPHPSGRYCHNAIQEFVWMACEHIRALSDQPVASAILKYKRVCDTKKFSVILLKYERGLSNEERLELKKQPSKMNQRIIYDAAHRLRNRGAELTYEEYRRELFFESQRQMESELVPQWAKVYDEITVAGFHFSDWKTYFYAILIIPACVFGGRWDIALPILVISSVVSFLICRNPEKSYHRWFAVLVPVAVLGIYRLKIYGLCFLYEFNGCFEYNLQSVFNTVGCTCYMFAAGLLGIEWSKRTWNTN